MFDINFFKKSYPLKKNLTEGKLSLEQKQNIEKEAAINVQENLKKETQPEPEPEPPTNTDHYTDNKYELSNENLEEFDNFLTSINPEFSVKPKEDNLYE